jgi:flagellin
MSSGLSIVTNLLANQANLHLSNSQAALKRTVTQLSSGLRINTAADDPSGLAIAEKLSAQVSGFNTGANNVQDATNAINVADGALATTTDILQRIRTLAVEASSDITSDGDRANLQAEVSQLLLEVNRVSQNTQFNGTPLLDGSHAGFLPAQSASIVIESNAVVTNTLTFLPVQDGAFRSSILPVNQYSLVSNFGPWELSPANTFVYNNTASSDPAIPGEFYPVEALGAGTQGAGLGQNGATLSQTVQFPAAGTYYLNFLGGEGQGTTAQLGVTVDGVQQGALLAMPTTATPFSVPVTVHSGGPHTISFVYHDPSSVPNIGIAQVSLTTTPIDAADGGLAGPTAALLVASAVAANANFFTTAGALGTLDGSIELQVINTGVSIAVETSFINTATGKVSVSSFLAGANAQYSPFDNVKISLGAFGTNDVGASSYIKVLQNVAALTAGGGSALSIQTGADEGATIQIGLAAVNTNALRISAINLLTSSHGNPSFGAEDAIGQIDAAVLTLLYERAQLGSVAVRLAMDGNNDNVAAVNLQASESSLRDLNVGAATTEFTREQILVQVGTSVLAQSNTNAQSVLALFR